MSTQAVQESLEEAYGRDGEAEARAMIERHNQQKRLDHGIALDFNEDVW